jgi:hypothetical protein
MAAVVFIAFAAHVIAWIALPDGKVKGQVEASRPLVGGVATA